MTVSSIPSMPVSYDPLQVTLSVIIAIASSYAALDLAGRVMATRNAARLAWLIGGALTMGSGIWAMHFVGMLAFHLPVPVFYYWPTTLLALVVTIIASAAGLFIVTLKGMGLRYAVISGVIMGSGVAALHYLGMTAMRMPARYRLNPEMVSIAVLLGIGFAIGGMWLGYYFRREPKRTVWKRLGSGVLMGAGVSSMHYTGMASASFTSSDPPALTHTVHVSALGTLGISAVILDLLGTAVAACAVGRELDAQRGRRATSEARVELAHRMRLTAIGEVTASIAHEIRQPLAAIITNANYCLRQLAGPTPNLGEVRQAIDEIVEDGNRTNSIVSGIRTLLRKEPSEDASLDLNQLIHDVIDAVQGELDSSMISLVLELADSLPPVHGDRVQLQQAFMNLVMNSIDALRSVPEKYRQLLIRSAEGEREVIIQVKDTGPGIDAQTAERLFEPFFTTKPEGMGLGLSISRSILESHGGNLSNLSVSGGALFQLTIPAHPRHE